MDEIIRTAGKKKRWPFVLGLLILILAVVGGVSVVQRVIGLFGSNQKDTADYGRYADFLTWVVGVDPDPFTDVTKANYESLLNIAMCSLLTDEVKTGEYTVTDDGMKVPASAVEEKFRSMFGTEVAVVHAGVVGYGYQFTYDAATATYTVPLTGVTPPFTPRIVSASHTGGLVTLTVGYVGTSNIEVGPDGTVAAAQPDKYREITLMEDGEALRLVSVRAITQGERQ